MNALEQYIGDLNEVKLWFNADLYNGDGVALPSDGAVISSIANLPKDLKTNTDFSFVNGTTNTAVFRTNPNRIEFTSNDSTVGGNYGQVSVYKDLDIGIQNSQWICWIVASFKNSNTTRESLFTLNSNTYTLYKESNSQPIIPGFLPVPVFQIGGNSQAPVSTGTLSASELISRGLTIPTVYKIKNNGADLFGKANSIEMRKFNSFTVFTLNSIQLGKLSPSSGGRQANGNIYEVVYINTNNIAVENKIDTYLKLKYNI